MSCQFSPDSSRLASGSHDRIVRLFDASEGFSNCQSVATLVGHEGAVSTLVVVVVVVVVLLLLLLLLVVVLVVLLLVVLVLLWWYCC